jgi:hypothetical protein
LVTYSGDSANDYFGEVKVVASGEDLSLQLGPDPHAFALAHYDRDVFTYQPVGENAGPLSAVTFTIGAVGVATSVVIENLGIHGQGSFVRTEEESSPSSRRLH